MNDWLLESNEPWTRYRVLVDLLNRPADDPEVTSPISARKRLVRHEQLDCLSCVKNICPLKGDQHMACMKYITVQMVMEQIELL